MQDIEFGNTLLAYLRMGIEGDTAGSLNAVYDTYNTIYKERNSDFATVKRLLNRISKLFAVSDEIASLFGSVVHFYPLFVVLHSRFKKLSDKTIIHRLKLFTAEYAKKKSKSRLVEGYRVGASYRTRSKQSREKRVDALASWIIQK